jgi:hypothetical protein
VLAALERTTNRRGGIERCHSDNGSSFVKAKSVITQIQTEQEMRDELGEVDWVKVSESCEEVGIHKWSFSAPRSPEGNGAAEAMVKLAKKALQDTFREVKLTYDEFRTVLVKAEAKVNSRPLGVIPADHWEAIEIITPQHLLTGRLGTAFAPRVPVEKPKKWCEHWETIKEVTKTFEDKYVTMCLAKLMSMEKWSEFHNNMTVGTLVLLADDGHKRHDWKLGCVTKTKRDEEGVVRTALVKIKPSAKRKPIEMFRHVRQLVPLSVFEEEVRDNAEMSEVEEVKAIEAEMGCRSDVYDKDIQKFLVKKLAEKMVRKAERLRLKGEAPTRVQPKREAKKPKKE